MAKSREQRGSRTEQRHDEIQTTRSEFPKHPLSRAVRVAEVIEELNGGKPMPPTDIAIGMDVSPGSSDFRIVLSSSYKYGLTEGSYKQGRISLTPLGENIVLPKSVSDRREAEFQAAMMPETFRKMFDHFRGKKLPEAGFLENAAVREFGVPRNHAAQCEAIFLDNMERVGLLRTATTGKWLGDAPNWQSVVEQISEVTVDRSPSEVPASVAIADPRSSEDRSGITSVTSRLTGTLSRPANRRVFVSHGRNKTLIPQLKELLTFGEFQPVVSVERETVSKPVPDKVLDDMRSCCAAIIHVDAERDVVDIETEKPEKILNPNVLIEVGAAMALYGRNFILLVRDGVSLPSNLQGLYEVRYEGDALDGNATLRLLKAFNDFKSTKQ